MNKIISSKITALTFGILVVCFAIGFYVVAWQEPGQAPPGGNVPAPLNVGPTGQAKEGGLILNTGGAVNGLIIDKGNLCLGTDCRSSWPEGADLRNIQVTPIDWDAIRICQHGTCCPPWRDCDGDGVTYMARADCDEGCATCYVGSNSFTYEPDGKDQNCNGLVDDSQITSYTRWGYDGGGCNWVQGGSYYFRLSPFDCTPKCDTATACNTCIQKSRVTASYNPESSVICGGVKYYFLIAAMFEHTQYWCECNSIIYR